MTIIMFIVLYISITNLTPILTFPYTHYFKKEFPERFQDTMDPRLFGPGERIVFERYSREIFEISQQWIAERGIFEDGNLGDRDYSESIVSAAE